MQPEQPLIKTGEPTDWGGVNGVMDRLELPVDSRIDG